jgi:carbon-monoxide dehydrogenase medium subunit
LALGAAAPVPFRAYAAEEQMAGRPFDQKLMAAACEQVQRQVRPMDDIRASAEFRRELSRVLAGRALEDCAMQAGCTL